jgi:hypothetical protein
MYAAELSRLAFGLNWIQVRSKHHLYGWIRLLR